MNTFQRIGLIGRAGNRLVVDTIMALQEFLLKSQREVVIEQETALLLPTCMAHVCHRDKLGETCDLVIVVGGDGSMLGAARSLCAQQVPVLGINRGSLGFLTDIAPDQIESRLHEVLQGRYVVEKRFLLDATLVRDGATQETADALNEVVIHRGTSLRMIEFELYIDGQFVFSQHSDGLIISTPTGSTAYALSGGGPILQPALDALALVPMFPHTLTSRPIVVGGDSEIRIVIGAHGSGQPKLSCDGQKHIDLLEGDVVYIRKKPQLLNLVHPEDYNYYDTCRTKLGWGSRLS